jgi:hypothetical protein
MDGHPILRWFEQALGFALILLVLLDVFLTVLYARVGSGIVSHHVACWTWRVFRTLSKPFTRRREQILSLCGPATIVLVIWLWFFTLMFGSALVIHPKLGTSITAAAGPTPTDLGTAMYVSGDAMTTVGMSDMAPRTPFFRLFYTFTSFLGLSIITLTITYLLEIYNALQERNTLSLKLHFASAETGDAAELLAGIGPEGNFDRGYAHLAEIGAEMTAFKESHHFYSALVYFRFREPHYALSRLALITLDTVTLIKSALDDRKYAWLKESAAVTQLWSASMHLLTLLAATFLPGGLPDAPNEPDPEMLARWRQRYAAGVRRLRQANIETMADEQAGAEVYCSLRARWDRYIRTFAAHMAHDFTNIDPVGCNPERADERQEFRTRLRAAG